MSKRTSVGRWTMACAAAAVSGGLAAVALAGDLEVDNVTVHQDANFYGTVKVAAYAPASPATNGLVLYYAFDTNSATVEDLSASGHDGTVNGATWVTNGISPGAFSYDGTNDYIDMGANFSGMDEITVCGWVYYTADPQSAGLIAAQYGAGWNTDVWWLWGDIDSGKSAVEVKNSGYEWYVLRGTQLQLNQWKFVCMTYKRNDALKLYEQGQVVDSVAVSDAPLLSYTQHTAKIGANQAGDGYFGKGIIDEVRIYDRALTATEVKDLYYACVSNQAQKAQLIADAIIVQPQGDVGMGIYTNRP